MQSTQLPGNKPRKSSFAEEDAGVRSAGPHPLEPRAHPTARPRPIGARQVVWQVDSEDDETKDL